jgi:hypothetical protein
MAKRKQGGREAGRIQLSYEALLGLVIGVAVLSACATYWWSGAGSAPPAPAAAPAAPVRQQPWGELLISQIQLERPTDCIVPEGQFSGIAEWVFPGMSIAEAGQTMLDCGVASNQVARALAAATLAESPARVIIPTDDELAYSLTPEARTRLYAELAAAGMNHYIQFPFCFQAEAVDEWLGHSGVDDKIIEHVRRLLYRRGSAMCFSDVGVVMRSITDSATRQQLLRTLSRQTAVLPRLRVGPDTDIDAVLNYWGRAIDPKNVRPLLESLKRMPEGGSMSMIYLLPPFARERLYTFPEDDTVTMDCHWTSMNFFNHPPDNRFSDPAFTVQHLVANYQVVPQAARLGDVVLVLNAVGNAIHSAVYLADDLVFTKNGNNTCQAWIIMRLPDLLATYSSEAQQRVVVYRDKRW